MKIKDGIWKRKVVVCSGLQNRREQLQNGGVLEAWRFVRNRTYGTKGLWQTENQIGDIHGANANWSNLFMSAKTGTFSMPTWTNKPDWWK